MENAKAFTLFEVMMAMGIFGIAVIGMMMALNAAMSAAKEARVEHFIRTELENRIARMESEKAAELHRTIELKIPRITFVETMRRERVTGADLAVLDGFWRVSVLATWNSEGGERVRRASFLRYGP